jgi:hypothetical protein
MSSNSTISALDLGLDPDNSYQRRWDNAFDSIESGQLESDEVRGYLSAQMSVCGKSAENLEEIQTAFDTRGAKVWLTSSWTYEFYLYHSPAYGQMVVYKNNSNEFGWYSITLSQLRMIFYEVP